MTKSRRLLGVFAALAMAFGMVSVGLPASADDTPRVDFSISSDSYTFDSRQVGYDDNVVPAKILNNTGTVPVKFTAERVSSTNKFECYFLRNGMPTRYSASLTVPVSGAGNNRADLHMDREKGLPVGTHSETWKVTATSTEDSSMSVSKTLTLYFTVTGLENSIAINRTNLTGLKYLGGPVTLSLQDVGQGSGAVTWASSDSSVMTISGNTATITGAGITTITATKASDGTYAEATDSVEVAVGKASAPHITFPTASDITYGQRLADSALTGGSTEYGTFAWDDASIVPGVGTVSYGVTFRSSAETDRNYAPIPDANKKQDVNVTVAKATPEMTLNAAKKFNKATLTATVKKVGSLDAPTGDVMFKYSLNNGATWENISGTPSYESDADGNLVATLPDWDFSVLGEQDAWILAEYSGDSNYKTAAISMEFDSTLPLKHTVTFDLDGGSFATSVTTVPVYEGATVSDPTAYPTWDYPEKDGWRFDGWYADASFSVPFDFDVPIVADTVIYAKYLKVHKVTWDLGGASFPTQDLDLEDGWSTEIPTAEEVVNGWGIEPPANTKYDGVDIDGVHYAPGSTFILTKDIVVKVEWKSTLPYTVIWLDGDGSELDRATYMDGEAEPTTGKTPTKAADADYTYVFDAWDAGSVDGRAKTYKPVFRSVAKPKPTGPSTPSSSPTNPAPSVTPTNPVPSVAPTNSTPSATPTSPVVAPTDLVPSVPPSDTGAPGDPESPSGSGASAPGQTVTSPLVNTGANVIPWVALAFLLAGGLLLAYRRKTA